MRRWFCWLLSLFLAVPLLGADRVCAKAVISEVMWMGTSLSTSDEWVEIAGLDSASGSTALGDWTLTTLDSTGKEKMLYHFGSGASIGDGQYAIVSHYHADSSRLLAEPAFVTTSMSLLNSKLLLRLRDASGNITDEVDDGAGDPFAGANPSGGPKASMERIDLRQPGTLQSNWTTASQGRGFDAGATDLGTPGFANDVTLPPLPDATNFLWSWLYENSLLTLVLHWITPVSVDITSQRLSFDPVLPSGSASILLSSHASGAEIFGMPFGSGFHIILQSLGSLGRISPGIGIQVKPYPKPISGTGSSSSSQSVSSGSGSGSFSSSSESSVSSGSLISPLRISEVFPDPPGTDTASFVEIANTGSGAIPLSGWSLMYGSHEYSIPGSGALLPGQYLSFRKVETDFAFNHGGGTVMLKHDGVVWDTLSYPSLPEGVSFGFHQGSSSALGELCYPTEGEKNEQPLWNPSLVLQSGVMRAIGHVTVNFVANATWGFGGPMQCSFSFGDGKESDSCNPPSQAYEDVGVYTVSATMTNACGSTVTQKETVEVLPDSSTTYATSGFVANAQSVSSSSAASSSVSSVICIPNTASGVLINEFLPNPLGDDKAGEWVELRNLTNQEISLCGWQLAAGLKTISAFALDALEIPPKGFLILSRSLTKISLTNESGEVRLFAPVLGGSGRLLVHSVPYEKAKDGYSYARKDDGTFAWTETFTPSATNEFLTSETSSKSTKSIQKITQTKALSSKSSSARKSSSSRKSHSGASKSSRASSRSSTRFQNPYLAQVGSDGESGFFGREILSYLPILTVGISLLMVKVMQYFLRRRTV